MKFEIFSKTKTGSNKATNQDSYTFGRNKFGQSLFAIADGVGTYRGSATASRTACEYLHQQFLTVDLDAFTPAELSQWTKTILQKDLPHQFATIPQKIATTLSFLIFLREKIYIAHVGDTRIYKKKEENSPFFQLTHDHSSNVNQTNKISWTQGNTFLQNAIGNTSNCFIDETSLPLERGFFLLTTDGIHDFVARPKLNEIFNQPNLSLDEKIQTIFNHAIFQGSIDDLTLLLVKLT